MHSIQESKKMHSICHIIFWYMKFETKHIFSYKNVINWASLFITYRNIEKSIVLLCEIFPQHIFCIWMSCTNQKMTDKSILNSTDSVWNHSKAQTTHSNLNAHLYFCQILKAFVSSDRSYRWQKKMKLQKHWGSEGPAQSVPPSLRQNILKVINWLNVSRLKQEAWVRPKKTPEEPDHARALAQPQLSCWNNRGEQTQGLI